MFIDCHAHSLSADEKRYPPRDHPLRPFDPDDPHSPGRTGPTVIPRSLWHGHPGRGALHRRDARATWVAQTSGYGYLRSRSGR